MMQDTISPSEGMSGQGGCVAQEMLRLTGPGDGATQFPYGLVEPLVLPSQYDLLCMVRDTAGTSPDDSKIDPTLPVSLPAFIHSDVGNGSSLQIKDETRQGGMGLAAELSRSAPELRSATANQCEPNSLCLSTTFAPDSLSSLIPLSSTSETETQSSFANSTYPFSISLSNLPFLSFQPINRLSKALDFGGAADALKCNGYSLPYASHGPIPFPQIGSLIQQTGAQPCYIPAIPAINPPLNNSASTTSLQLLPTPSTNSSSTSSLHTLRGNVCGGACAGGCGASTLYYCLNECGDVDKGPRDCTALAGTKWNTSDELTFFRLILHHNGTRYTKFMRDFPNKSTKSLNNKWQLEKKRTKKNMYLDWKTVIVFVLCKYLKLLDQPQISTIASIRAALSTVLNSIDSQEFDSFTKENHAAYSRALYKTICDMLSDNQRKFLRMNADRPGRK